MQKPPKRDPRGKNSGRHQCGKYVSALLIDIAAAFFDGVIIEMEFIVAELPAQRILLEVGSNDNLQCARAEMGAERLAGHFFVNFDKHYEIIPSLTNCAFSCMEKVICERGQR